MSYMKCPTCKTLFGDKEIVFRKKEEEIFNSNMSKEERDKTREKILTDIGFDPLENYCCRMRFITMIDTAKLIK